MYSYYLYGFGVQSDICIFNIPQENISPADIDITISTNSNVFSAPIEDKRGMCLDSQLSYLITPYGALVAEKGSKITVHALPENIAPITPFIIGWGMAFILFQKGFSAFHCTALESHGKCFFISGVSGAGKSSTALALQNRGYKYLADDIAIVKSLDDMLVPPAYPIQKVCPDRITTLDEKLLYAIPTERGKYSYLNSENYVNSPRPLSVIFKLNICGGDSVIVQEATGIEKFLRVLECLYLAHVYVSDGTPNQEKYNCLKIAEKVRVIEIFRPRGKDTIDEISDIIISIMEES